MIIHVGERREGGDEMKNRAVVQEWMCDLTWKQQTVVLCALRGCDGLSKDDSSKRFHKLLRSHVLENAGTENTPFMLRLDNDLGWSEQLDSFARDLDKFPTHYISHFMHAVEIIGYYHPDDKVRNFWNQVYLRFVKALHLYPETKEQNEERLSDGIDSD